MPDLGFISLSGNPQSGGDPLPEIVSYTTGTFTATYPYWQSNSDGPSVAPYFYDNVSCWDRVGQAFAIVPVENTFSQPQFTFILLDASGNLLFRRRYDNSGQEVGSHVPTLVRRYGVFYIIHFFNSDNLNYDFFVALDSRDLTRPPRYRRLLNWNGPLSGSFRRGQEFYFFGRDDRTVGQFNGFRVNFFERVERPFLLPSLPAYATYTDYAGVGWDGVYCWIAVHGTTSAFSGVYRWDPQGNQDPNSWVPFGVVGSSNPEVFWNDPAALGSANPNSSIMGLNSVLNGYTSALVGSGSPTTASGTVLMWHYQNLVFSYGGGGAGNGVIPRNTDSLRSGVALTEDQEVYVSTTSLIDESVSVQRYNASVGANGPRTTWVPATGKSRRVSGHGATRWRN